MTQDEIIEMARQAGLSVENPQWGYSERHHIAGWITNFEAFAKLVADKAIKDAPDYKMGYADGVAVEREACAKVCENEWSNVAEKMYGLECAAAIRARNQT